MLNFKHSLRLARKKSSFNVASWLSQTSIMQPHRDTSELVNLLLTHGARAWRLSQPRLHIKMKLRAKNGIKSVRFRV